MDAKKQIKFMTYNVWCREDVVVYKRMKAIGDLVREHSPDVIFFQEITPYIHSIFESFAWWKDYHCSPVPTEGQFCLMLSKLRMESYARWNFGTSPTGKCYLEADIAPGPSSLMKPIRIATTQLECPVPENVVLGGDMSWDDDADLPFPLPGGWCDARAELNPETGSYYSWTYDSFWVEKLWEFNGHLVHRPLTKKRSDRFVCRLQDYTLKKIQLIEGNRGFEAFGCIRYTNYMSGSHEDLALKASCHRGLVLTIVPKL